MFSLGDFEDSYKELLIPVFKGSISIERLIFNPNFPWIFKLSKEKVPKILFSFNDFKKFK